MRSLFCAILAGAAFCAHAQVLQGNYKPGGKGVGTPWQINGHSALIWGGTPYLPIGIHVDANPASISAAKKAGFQDVLIDLPAADDGWQESLDALDKAGVRYVIRINSLTPMARGYAVDPAAYRVTDVTNKRSLAISLPDATEALVVVADKRDGAIESWARVPISGGQLQYNVDTPTESVVLLYPQTVSLQEPDFWEGMDDHRDRVLASLRRHPPGPGLRGFVNPLGKCLTLPSSDPRFIPNSPAFKLEFAEFLDQRYRNVVTVLKSWGLSSDVVATAESGESKDAYKSFSELTSFVPLWSGSRGVPDIWDPVRNQLYACSRKQSTIWKDVADSIADAEARRFSRMVSDIRQFTDVPVVQEWAGWAPPYETIDPTVDGIGMKSTGTLPSSILASTARATSSMLRWKTPGWLPATEIDLQGAGAASQVGGVLDDLLSLGARGVFFKTEDPTIVKAIAAEETQRSGDSALANGSPQAIFYPENASNPAVTQRLPGGKWWLPCPEDGNRIDYGNGFFGYRMMDPGGPKVVIWSRVAQRVLLHMAEPKRAGFQTCDGRDPHPKLSKKGVEIDLSENPLIITGDGEIPVPDPAYQAASATVAAILDEANNEHLEFDNEKLALSDAYEGFDRNPGGAFLTIRALIHAVSSEIGDFSWVEAERSKSNSFSEILFGSEYSGGGALALHASIDSASSYYADYTFDVHTKAEQQVWLAAKIPPDQLNSLTVRIGSQTFTPTGQPIGLYAGGFGWYHLGDTRLLDSEATMRVTVVGQSPDLAIDAFAFVPSTFRPDGVTMPEPTVSLKAGQKKGKRGHGRGQQGG